MGSLSLLSFSVVVRAAVGPPRGIGAQLVLDQRHQLPERIVEVLVDDDVRELGLRGDLLPGDLETPLDLIGVVGRAAQQALAQRLVRGRRDEHLDRLLAGSP